jgi:DNA-binding transcriptional LysR family regulator
MDLNEIVVFAKVVETKSFTAAADLLGLPKSTVSRKLAQLEERLGVRLLQRTTRKLALTDIGQAYYERCARIVADATAAEQLVTDMQSSPRGLLRVTAPVDLAASHLGPIVGAFTGAHPDVHIELDGSDRVVDMIEENFDVAVRFGPLTESTLVARKLCKITSHLVATPAYLAAHPAPKEIDELDDHDRVLFAPVSRVQSWTLTRGEQTYEFGRPAKITSNILFAVRAALLEGCGIGLAPSFMVARDIEVGRLVHVLPEWAARSQELYAVYPGRQNVPPKLSLFLDHLQAAMNPPPWTRGRETRA